MRVLIVDEDNRLASLLDAARQGRDEVAIAASGNDAISVFSKVVPDVALLAMDLPDISGITLAGILRGIAGEKGLRVIGLGEAADMARLEEATGRGIFDAYLTRPVILATLETLLRGDP